MERRQGGGLIWTPHAITVYACTLMLLKVPVLVLTLVSSAVQQLPQRGVPPPQQPFLVRDSSSRVLYSRILEAEDRRELTKSLIAMLDIAQSHSGVRRRAAIAIGRIGDPAGVAPLIPLLDPKNERNPQVRADIAFALGEIEPSRQPELGQTVARLLEVATDSTMPAEVRARAVEALGKIGGNATAAGLLGQPKLAEIAGTVAATLPAAGKAVSGDDLLLASLATTALLRLKQPASLGPLIGLLSNPTVDLRWQASNAIARLRPDPAAAASAVPVLLALLKDGDAIVRANAARALGAVRAVSAFDALVTLLSDRDQRVVASAIRVLGAFGDARAVAPLNAMGQRLADGYRKHVDSKRPGVADEHTLLMLVAEALGALKDASSLPLLQALRRLDGHVGANPETELAVAAYGETAFFDIPAGTELTPEWHHVANYAQGLGAVGGDRAKREALDLVGAKRFGELDSRAQVEVVGAVAKLKVDGIEQILIDQLAKPDFYVRATAAALLAESFAGSQSELTFKALEPALKVAAQDKETDARLAILDAIAKFKRERALELLSGALADPDYLVRRRAAELLEAAGAGQFMSRVPPATTTPRPKDYYERLELAMRGANPVAVIATDKGDIRVELLIREAPMTVDNFVQLARTGYFDGIAFHRVVPNFVVQGGDPRGDGNGGPGYQFRCEINEVPYLCGAVGMALSGKDTGGSQFFITHSPQPHLDGGYTVFGQVTSGLDVVDRLARGDRIHSVTIVEGSGAK